MQKNIAGQKWVVFAFDTTTGAPKTGDALNITANLRLDGGAANPIDDTNPTELEGGYYAFDISQAETNADMIVICPSSVTANIAVIGVPGAVWTDSDFTATMKASLNAATPAASNMRGTDGAALAVDLAVVDGIVDAIKVKTDTINAAGALIWTYTLTIEGTTTPIPDAEVRLTSDSAGTTTIRTATTNSLGVATFYFDPSDSGITVYVWRSHAGYNFTNPDAEVIS